MRRASPCTECRKVSAKCTFDSDSQICIRCSTRPHLACSGPTRKTPLPCEACKKLRTKCVRKSDGASCERCDRRGRPCVPLKASAEARAAKIHLPSEQLSEALNQYMTDLRLVDQGRNLLQLLEYFCTFDVSVEGANIVHRQQPSTLDAAGVQRERVDQVQSDLYLLLGVKFSGDSVVVGADVTLHFPPDIGSMRLIDIDPGASACGIRRQRAVESLTTRIWESLTALDFHELASTHPADSTKHVAVLFLASIVCDFPADLEQRRVIRALFGWAATNAVAALEGNEPIALDDRLMMASCGSKLAYREGLEAITVGEPSFISTKTFHRACRAANPGPNPLLSPASLSIIYASPAPPRSPQAPPLATFNIVLDGFIRNELLPPMLSRVCAIVREVSEDVHANLRSCVLDWWSSLDSLFDHYDIIVASILNDARNSAVFAENVAMVLRALFTVEQATIEIQLLIHRALVEVATTSGDVWSLRMRVRSEHIILSSIRRSARRMRIIMNTESLVSDALCLFCFFLRNVVLLGDDLTRLMLRIPRDEYEAILKALRLAAYWDAEAGKRLESLMDVSLGDSRDSNAVAADIVLATLHSLEVVFF